MNYKETTEWLFSQLPMFQNQGASAYKDNLSNVILLDDYLKNPHKKFKTIHIAGTNGKGSTSSLLASVLQEAGYKVGLYTSPHLKDFRERIKINGEMITEEFVINFVANNKPFFEANKLSFFEMTVGMAFDYFSKEGVDVAIVEVGMGGRLDATNIVNPLVSVITNIGLDHTQFLGDTLEKIAIEKAGIIKLGTPIVIGEYVLETKKVFQELADKNNAPITFAQDLYFEDLPCELLGDYQKQNKKTVLAVLEILKNYFSISEKAISKGFLKVVSNTGLLGRWQILNLHPKVVCDTAHNSHGLKIVLDQIKKEEINQLHIVLGVVNDKDLDSILPLFPKKAKYYFCKPNISRGLSSASLQKKAGEYSLFGDTYNSVSEAYEVALSLSSKTDFIYIGGSTFVVAEIV
ncbi:bifunctional folylpolyglutamate synthase/dihydrofolate synthase [Flavobacterium sediminilitoris]|uniref:Dihydrofolate synthase/folylpolyglutamate synthase n=1 Tax=Flavobacterium sediminilitoris TaxID=2024526 RepID=A0ABY4HSM5_9FLAO|nr:MULTISPECIES: folylpolyglutamate synthase/dihydrofolate synthase family protein [Flavobacterium]UOX34539.1 bifunctional folylpolyglutamate synthase/dihydrofolate synthase [Flavobacterium sediminilitoris]